MTTITQLVFGKAQYYPMIASRSRYLEISKDVSYPTVFGGWDSDEDGLLECDDIQDLPVERRKVRLRSVMPAVEMDVHIDGDFSYLVEEA